MNVDELREIAREELGEQEGFAHRVIVCSGTGCQSLQSDLLVQRLEGEVKQRGLERWCEISHGGCRGLCAEGPLVTVEPRHVLYQHVKPETTVEIVASLDTAPVERLLCDVDMPFFARQQKVVLEHN